MAKFIELRVKPNARRSCLEQQPDGTWLALLKSPPVEGRANAEVVALVAAHFGCRRAQVSIRSGASGRRKLLRIDDP